MYKKNNVKDINLLNRIDVLKPDYIIINIGGQTQEVLGIYIKENLNYNIKIICTGAAICILLKKTSSNK